MYIYNGMERIVYHESEVHNEAPVGSRSESKNTEKSSAATGAVSVTANTGNTSSAKNGRKGAKMEPIPIIQYPMIFFCVHISFIVINRYDPTHCSPRCL